MKTKYFGTDGIRGKSFTFLNAKLAYKIGQSLKEVYKTKQVVIGLDTRSSSPMLAHMIASGALSVGMDVLYAGVVSTPMIAHYSLTKEITGIMVTASHNPYTDNGIKVFNKGFKSTKEDELIIEEYIDGKNPDSEDFGIFSLTNDVEREYLKVINSLGLISSNLKVAYDSANGANYLISKKIMDKYFVNSKQINFSPNGENINLNCGSTHLGAIQQFVIDNKMDIGFSYDGDGDRVLMVGKDGTIYDGDMIIYIIAKHLKELGQLTNNTVVLTKMSNPGILKALSNEGINYVLTDVGDKYVSEAMTSNNYILGGEASGHMIISSILHSGDGLLVSLYILKTLLEEDIDLEDITKDVNLYPLQLVNIANINKNVLQEKNVIEYLENIEKEFNKEDIFLIRASGTEDLLRVTISCRDEVKLNKVMEQVVSYLKEKGEKL